MNRDVLSGAVLLGVAVVYGTVALGIPRGDGEPGPGALPLALAWVLGVLSIVVIVRGARDAGPGSLEAGNADGPGAAHGSGIVPDSDSTPVGDRPAASRARPWIAALATLAYVALFQPLGFALSTLAYTGALASLFGRDRRVAVAVSIGVTLALFLFFRVALGVRLPTGPLG